MKSETIEVGGVEYTVKQLKVRDIMPVLEGGMEAKSMGFEMFKASVNVGGKPIGDMALDLSIPDFNELYSAVNRINGSSQSGKD